MGLLKTLIKLLLWLAGLGVVALAALVILVAKIDPNEHKDWLEARFHKETGREISLDGPIAFTFYPWLGVEAADVSIADAEEFGAAPFASLDYLKLRVKFLPLLREEYEVDTIAVRGAVVNLVRNEQGTANWDAFDGEAGERDKPMLPLAAVALGGVDIEDARVTLEDRQAAARHEFSGIDVSTAELKYGEPVDISLGFRARSDKPALDAAVSGVITYATDGVQFDLAVDQIDLDRYLAPDSRAKQTGGKAAALPIAALAAADLDGDLIVDRLIVSKARLDGFRMRLNARDGVLRAYPVTAALYEGRLSADITVDVNPEMPSLTLNSNLTGIEAEPMLMDMTGKARLRGKGNFTAALTAQGDSVAAMKRSLNGPMSLNFTEGAITGFNLGRALRQWKQFKKGQIIDVEDSAATDFTDFIGNPVAKAGIIRMDDLELKAPAFRLQGEGVLADLHTDTIDYRAVATVVNTAKGAGGRELADLEGLALPLIVDGGLDNPKIRLAWEDILAGSLVEQVLDVFDLKLPGAQTPEESENEQETEEESEIDPLQELLKEGLKEGLKGIFRKN